MTRINLKRAVLHVPHGQIHGVPFEPGEQDVHEKDAATFISEGWADPLAPAPTDEGAGTVANGASTPDPVAPSPDSGQAAPSSASPPAPASPKRQRKPAAKRKPPAKPA